MTPHAVTDNDRDFVDTIHFLLSYEPAWFKRAACRKPENKNVDFFPTARYGSYPALKICADCPVRDKCAQDGEFEEGIWGGQTMEQRRRKQK